MEKMEEKDAITSSGSRTVIDRFCTGSGRKTAHDRTHLMVYTAGLLTGCSDGAADTDYSALAFAEQTRFGSCWSPEDWTSNSG
jgi:hypothetical protein